MPDAPPQVASNGSGTTPASPVQISANGAASTPAAPPTLLPEQEAGSLYPARIRVTGALTRDGSIPILFPDLIRTVDFNGRPAWTNTGEDWDSELGGNYGLVYNSDLFSWELHASVGTGFGFGGGNDASPLQVDDWAPFNTETGTPVLTTAPASPLQLSANGSGSTPAAPVQVAANGSGSTPSAPPAIV